MSFFPDAQKMGTSFPAASDLGMTASSSSGVIGSSIKNFSVKPSSTSMAASINCPFAVAKSTATPAGGAGGGFITSTTPVNLGPIPTGALNKTQPLPKDSRM